MKHKTCIVLSAISFGLRALALIAVLAVTVFQEPIKRLYNPDPEILAIHSVPWAVIVQGVILLAFSLIILLVLVNRPGRGGTVALTVVMAVLLGVFSALIFPALSAALIAGVANRGVSAMASYNALANAVSVFSSVLSTPASILSLLALGGACGKDFRREA